MKKESRGQFSVPVQSLDDELNAHRKPLKSKQRPWWSMIAALVAALVALTSITAGYARWGSRSTAGQVAIGLQLAPTNLDLRNTSGTSLEQLLIGNVYEALLTRNSDNTVSPGIAQSWQVSDDRKQYTFHLHKDITFSNGHELDAQDVVWSIHSMMDKELQGSLSLANFESVRATDAHTVVLTLSAPYSELLWNLSGRAGVVYDKDAKYDAKTQAIGSGPYTITSYEPGVSVTLQARDNYWSTDHKPQTQTVVVRYFTDPQAGLHALESNDVQVLSPINSQLAATLSQDSRFHVQVGEGTDKYVLAFNNAQAPFTDKRVRQAIRYAIDEKAIIASRGGTDAALGGPISSLDPGYEDLTGLYKTDVTKAQELLKQAGYSTHNPLKLRLTYANIYPAEIGQQLRSQLAKIGIDLTVQRTEFATWLSQVYKNHDFDISMVDHNDSHDFKQWANPDYYYGYNNQKVQQLYAQAMQARSDDERDTLLAQAARIVSEDAPADWIMNFRVVTAWRTNVEGFPLNLNQSLMSLWQVRVR
ncbi:ABC transporter substrate-binding protein [Alloscardovia omnicolens]|uniref:ABC transporter substrate-binding protein n=1 Tax=Alloscardovia omnicolens TaxID=419015 RepID=UPI003A740E1E